MTGRSESRAERLFEFIDRVQITTPRGRFFVLGGPVSSREMDAMKLALLEREGSEAFAFADRVNDRVIAKAQGLLAFNAIIAAAALFVAAEGAGGWFVRGAFGSSFIASVCTLASLFVFWADAETVRSRGADLEMTVYLVCRRAALTGAATLLSLAASAMTLGAFLAFQHG
ncbi:hypothetical protein [Salinarimonas sp.]|uniref:hypothetical protein n=1 Tax=Salinarimonas sp. TaxID=2766526 RepID=UPI0032D9A4DD